MNNSVEIVSAFGRRNNSPYRAPSSRQDLYKENSDQKTSNMSKPCNSTSHPHVHDLQEEPKAENDSCRDGNDTDEKE